MSFDPGVVEICICKPYWRHLTEKFRRDFKHQLHKWSAGMILINHKEPNTMTAKELHADYVLWSFKLLVPRKIDNIKQTLKGGE